MAAKIVPIRRDDIGPIEDGVPAPPDAGLMGRPRKYPFGQMKPGQSFTAPLSKYRSIRVAALSYARNHPPRKFAVREEGTDRIRIWRIK